MTENITRLDEGKPLESDGVAGNGHKVMSNPTDNFGDLLVNHARSLHVRVSRENLVKAVTYRMLAALLERLINPEDIAPNIQTVLQSQNVIPAADPRFSITEFGEKLLYERGSSVRADIQLEKIFVRRGLVVARQALGKAASQLLSDENLNLKAQQIGEGILDVLNDVKSFSTHLDCLKDVVEELNQLDTAIRARIDNCIRRVAAVQSRLNASAPQQQTSNATKPGRWEGLRQRYDNVRDRLNQRFRMTGDAPASKPARVAEKELLELELENRALNAELYVIGQVVVYFNREISVDENSLRVLADERQKSQVAAEEAEKTRDYSIAAGEMLLNDASLSEAAMSYVFGGNDACAYQVMRLREHIQPLLIDAQGEVTSSVVAQMQQAVHDEVYNRLKDFIATDAIAALHMHDENFGVKLGEAFRMSVAPDFLAAGYENYLDPQKFVSVSLTNLNPVTNELLNELFRTLHLQASIKYDNTDTECLRLHIEYFSLPLKAFRFFDNSSPLHQEVKDEPRFNIHHDLHR